MIHFAYPNVIPKKGLFIGCGRYGVLHETFPLKPEYIEVSETPNTPNRRHLEYALQLLAPASYDSNRIVVEKKDQPSHQYQGNSLDFSNFRLGNCIKNIIISTFYLRFLLNKR